MSPFLASAVNVTNGPVNTLGVMLLIAVIILFGHLFGRFEDL